MTESPIDPGPPTGWPRAATTLRLTDDVVGGAGAPLRTLVHAVAGSPWVWYSLVFGDYADNVLAIATHERLPGAHARHEIPPMGTAIDDPRAFDEYRLTPELREHLGIRLDVNSYSFDRREVAIRELRLHDDWFFDVRPCDPTGRRRVVNAILRTHGHWMGGVSADWAEVVEFIDDQLARGVEVKLKSHRRPPRLTATLIPPGLPWWQPKDRGPITVEDGRARIGRGLERFDHRLRG